MVKSVKDYGASAPSAGGSKILRSLTKSMQNLKVGFDRVAYRRAYDKFYFKRTATCPKCGEIKTKHMLKRHMLTAKCKKNAIKAEAST